mmetsp:Transcript_13956/g.29227  ORF Transcript_13956/g.29227 Transcript_13956/m.29227 type:complete len:212 (-) Transcript_13956:924-1559(-)
MTKMVLLTTTAASSARGICMDGRTAQTSFSKSMHSQELRECPDAMAPPQTRRVLLYLTAAWLALCMNMDGSDSQVEGPCRSSASTELSGGGPMWLWCKGELVPPQTIRLFSTATAAKLLRRACIEAGSISQRPFWLLRSKRSIVLRTLFPMPSSPPQTYNHEPQAATAASLRQRIRLGRDSQRLQTGSKYSAFLAMEFLREPCLMRSPPQT